MLTLIFGPYLHSVKLKVPFDVVCVQLFDEKPNDGLPCLQVAALVLVCGEDEQDQGPCRTLEAICGRFLQSLRGVCTEAYR